MLSIIIPSKNEIFLEKTTRDILDKATGEIEIFVMLDGYSIPRNEVVYDTRVRYIELPSVNYTQKRHGINLGVSLARGTHVMAVDAHCMFAEGFDEVLTRDCGEDMIVIPRRNRLDAENWCIQKQCDDRPPIDYEYIMFPRGERLGFHGFKWDERTREREHIMIDETITCQGSCWVMTKNWFTKNKFMQIEGFTGWGQEAEELCFTTWLRGGTVATDKNTWYAHLHKGRKYGRMYFMSKSSTRACNAYAYDYFMNNKVPNAIHDFGWLIDKFMPMPGWKENWREVLNYKEVKK